MYNRSNDENHNGLTQAFNRRRAKYAKQQRDKHGFITLTTPPKQSSSAEVKTLRSTIANDRPTVHIIQENKGGFTEENEYEKYDPEENADQFLINSGATILHSQIEITDSSGRNRVIVRRND